MIGNNNQLLFQLFCDQLGTVCYPILLKVKGTASFTQKWLFVLWNMKESILNNVGNQFWWPMTFIIGSHRGISQKNCYGPQREKIHEIIYLCLLDQHLLFLTTICRCLTIRQWLQTWLEAKPLILSKPRQLVKRATTQSMDLILLILCIFSADSLSW